MTAPPPTVDPASPKRQRLRRMRVIATGLLAAMAAVLVASLILKPAYPWLAWIESFTEAAMIGGLADWFAVVALFRRPMSLPFPHTAIVPRNKDRIGTELGRFVESHFLTPDNIARHLRRFDLIGRGARWLTDEANAALVAQAIGGYLPRLIESVADRDVVRLVGRAVDTRLAAVEVTGLSTAILGIITTERRHQVILDQVLGTVGSWLDNNRRMVKAKVGEQSRLTPGFLDGYIANRFIDGVIDLVNDVAADPDHALRHQFDDALATFAGRLTTDPDFRAKADALKRDFIGRLDLDQFVTLIWTEIKRRLTGQGDLASTGDGGQERGEGAIERSLTGALTRLGRELGGDPRLLQRVTDEFERLLKLALLRVRQPFATLIADTVRDWDAAQIADQIEREVGSDLQFIRINGTLVGGAAGLALHALLTLLSSAGLVP